VRKAEVILKLAEAALVAALAYMVAVVIPHQIRDAATAVRSDAAHEAADTRSALVAIVQPVANSLAALPPAVTGIADRRLGEAVKDANDRLGELVKDANDQLAAALDIVDRRTEEVVKIRNDLGPGIAQIAPTLQALQGSLNEVGPTVAALRPGFTNAGLLIADIRAAVAPNLECKGNGKCWPEAITATLGGVKMVTGEAGLTMRYWRKETPEITENVGKITGNAEKISHPHWYWKAAPVVGGIIAALVTKKL
jgi:hypothetical protein